MLEKFNRQFQYGVYWLILGLLTIVSIWLKSIKSTALIPTLRSKALNRTFSYIPLMLSPLSNPGISILHFISTLPADLRLSRFHGALLRYHTERLGDRTVRQELENVSPADAHPVSSRSNFWLRYNRTVSKQECHTKRYRSTLFGG